MARNADKKALGVNRVSERRCVWVRHLVKRTVN